MADSRVSPILTALQNALPGFPPEELSKSEDFDEGKARDYLKNIEHEDLAALAAVMLNCLVMFGNVRPIEISTHKPAASQPFDASAYLRDFQIALVDRIEREADVVRHNIDFVLSRDGGERREPGVIRDELAEVNRKYHEEANAWLETDDRLETPEDLDEAVRRFEDTRSALRPLAKKRLQLADELAAAEIRELVAAKERKRMSAQGRHAADALHDKPGGSREKAKDIREIWATGNYGTREECAEQVHESLKMSFSAARKALRNTPEPKRGA